MLPYANPEFEIVKTQYSIKCVEVIPKSHRTMIRRLSKCPYCKNQNTAKEMDLASTRELCSVLDLLHDETMLHYYCHCCSARFTNIFWVSKDQATEEVGYSWSREGEALST